MTGHAALLGTLVALAIVAAAVGLLSGYERATEQSWQGIAVLQERLAATIRLQAGHVYLPAAADQQPSISATEAARRAADGAGPNRSLVMRSSAFLVQLAVYDGVDVAASPNANARPAPGLTAAVSNLDQSKLVYLVSGDTRVPCSEIVATGDSSSRPALCSWVFTIDAVTGEVLSRFWGNDAFCEQQDAGC